MILRFAVRTDVGRRRQVNEDAYAIEEHLGLFLVADGMGGHRGGQVASRLASKAAVRVAGERGDADEALVERAARLATAANEEVFGTAQTDAALSGMGTTLVALLVQGAGAAVAHVGDSRAYRVREGEIEPLTHDHSVVADLVSRGEITEVESRSHPHRHVLTRAVGVDREVEVDVREISLAPGDDYVLCSDGLTGLVTDAEIAEEVSGSEDLELVSERLVALANDRGGSDNITVVLVRVG
ncbi:Stp1/IreP family PP2C-type Ser/Thr phosphatase [Myxococcota bacterium]|nr:Stp1/IreP family PP2C-type Ser/Thr phosphatase [Myxococcota bacterium]